MHTMDSTIERHIIRAAVALAAASSHGHTAEIIADVRDEAAQLIGLCARGQVTRDDVRAWCDDATSLLARVATTGAMGEEPMLVASAAVLRLRLSVTRTVTAESEKKSRPSSPAKSRTPEESKPIPVELSENQQKVVAFVADHPSSRSKEIIDGLSSVLSARSVKRYLSELTTLKVVQRTALGDGGVVYAVKH